jgi:hypothetical protein
MVGRRTGVSQTLGQFFKVKALGNQTQADAAHIKVLHALAKADPSWAKLDENKDSEEMLQALFLHIKAESIPYMMQPVESHFCLGGFCPR